MEGRASPVCSPQVVSPLAGKPPPFNHINRPASTTVPSANTDATSAPPPPHHHHQRHHHHHQQPQQQPQAVSAPPHAAAGSSSSTTSTPHFTERHYSHSSTTLLNNVVQPNEDRSLPLTPRSPSPQFSPPSSPKRQRPELTPEQALAALAAEDDLECRAAALGLTEATQRAWRETVIPPTPTSPSPTFSPPSSPKNRERNQSATLASAKLREGFGISDADSQGFPPPSAFGHASSSKDYASNTSEAGFSCDSADEASNSSTVASSRKAAIVSPVMSSRNPLKRSSSSGEWAMPEQPSSSSGRGGSSSSRRRDADIRSGRRWNPQKAPEAPSW